MADRVFFGSLELQEQARLEKAATEPRFVLQEADDDEAGSKMVSLDNLPTINGLNDASNSTAASSSSQTASSDAAPQRETMELSESAKLAQEQHAVALIQLEAQRKARTMFIPTDNEEVKSELRKAGEPITLFGEGPAERRERLRQKLAEKEVQKMLASQGLSEIAAAAAAENGSSEAGAAAPADARAGSSAPQSELFYTPASDALIQARGFIAAYSFERASKRLSAERAVAASPEARDVEDTRAARLHASVARMRPAMSQPADDRSGSCCGVTRDGSLLATGSWGSAVKVWDAKTAELRCVLRGHRDRVVATAWHPSAGMSGGSHSDTSSGHASAHSGLETEHSGHPGAILATGSVDGTAKLWRLPAEALQPAPASRASSAAANGVGASLGANSAAMDVEDGRPAPVAVSRTQLLETGVREVATLTGHALRLCAVAWHPSGRFVGTASFDRTWRLWDAASGGTELQLQEGHAREVYALAFHGDGSLAASGDLGGVARVWDLRSGKSVITLKPHTKQLLALDWSPNGITLATGSDDNTATLWDLRAPRQLYTIPAHSGLVSRVK